jgi:hypothetical protein
LKSVRAELETELAERTQAASHSEQLAARLGESAAQAGVKLIVSLRHNELN